MALKSYALTTVARLKTFLGITDTDDDTLLETLIDAVTEFVENYCQRRFQQTAYTEEMYSLSKGDKIITLVNYPIITGETFTLEVRASGLNEDDWETVDTEFYHIDYDAGIIRSAGNYRFEYGIDKYRVTYTAGYDFDTSSKPLTGTEAGDLEYATWKLCAVAYLRRKGDPGIKSERIGDYAVTYTKEAFENPDVKAVLDKYKRISGDLGPLTPENI